jgi:hypothetical protein
MSPHFFDHRRRILLLAAAGLLAVLTLAPAALAPPASAAVIAPINLSPSGSTSSHTPTLAWSKASGAAKYEVQVDNNEDFSSPLFSASTTNTRVVPDKVLPSGDVSWRVRSVNSSGSASAWSAEMVTVASVGAPTPTSPVGGEALTQPDEPPLLTWTAVQGAVKYTVQIDETDDFISPISTTDTQTTSLVSPNPLATGAYFWRVKASLATGVDSDYSDAATFSLSPLDAVTIISPSDTSDNEIQDVVLKWQAVPGASYYEVEVATDSDFNSKIAGTPTKIYGTRYSPAKTFDNDQYFWRVRAVDTAGNKSPWPDHLAQFNRIWPDKPDAVYPLGPEGSPTDIDPGSSGDALYFQWTPVPHASQYEVQLGSDSNFSPGTYDSCVTGGTTYTVGNFRVNTETGGASIADDDSCYPDPGAVQYWRVRALDLPATSVEGLFSTAQAFTNEGHGMSGLSPHGGETVDIPTLSWDPVPGAREYHVGIKTASGTSLKTATTYSTSYTPVNISAIDPDRGPFTWSITAYDGAARQMTVTYQNTFKLSGNIDASSDDALTPTSGTDNDPATSRAPALRWKAYPDANNYRIFARTHGSSSWLSATSADVLDKKLPYPAVTDTSTRFHLPGKYDWYVKAYASDGSTLGEGAQATFTIKEIGKATDGRIALNGKSLDDDHSCTRLAPDTCAHVPATPVLDWKPVPDASLYLIYLSQDENFTNLVEPRTAIGATSQTRYTPSFAALKSALPDNTTDKPYWWVIRPCKSASACGPNPESVSGLATNKFRKSSPPITSLSPDNDATVTSADISLDWQDYLTTNTATTWDETGETSPQAARSYRVEVDNDATFASPLESAVVDQSTFTSSARLYPEGVLYWRVQATDADDNALSWSTPQKVTKVTAKVGLKAPVGGASVEGSPAFTWTSQASVGTYQLEVYANNDTAASAANKVFAATGLKQPAYVWTKPVPASSQVYVWRVRRMDPIGNAGPWSTWGSFKSGGVTPTLNAPAASAYQSANGPLFTWSPVAGAATYYLESRNVSTTAKVSGTPKSTPATGWATLATVPDGTWEWRVTAKNAGGGTIGVSGWRRFGVDTVKPTVTSKSPTTKASRTSNFSAKFSEPVKGVSTSTMRIYNSGSSTPRSAKVTLSSDKRTATLNPSTDLRPGSYYVIKLSSGITDLKGNALSSYSWKVKAY